MHFGLSNLVVMGANNNAIMGPSSYTIINFNNSCTMMGLNCNYTTTIVAMMGFSSNRVTMTIIAMIIATMGFNNNHMWQQLLRGRVLAPIMW
jgi:hypothetical protein